MSEWWVELGFGIGISIVGWAITLFVLRPRIEISKVISRVESKDPGRHYTYRLKIKNRRWLRNAVDLSFQCRFGAAGLLDDRAQNITYHRVPLSVSEVHQLRKRGHRVLQLYFHRSEKLPERVGRVDPELAQKVTDGTFRLEELFRLEKARLRFSVLCSDSLSNTTRAFERRYEAGSVEVGYFEAKTTRINRARSRGTELEEIERERPPARRKRVPGRRWAAMLLVGCALVRAVVARSRKRP